MGASKVPQENITCHWRENFYIYIPRLEGCL